MKPGRISLHDNQLVIEAPPHVSIRLRRLFGGAQRYKAGVFHLAATPEHAYDLDWFRDRHPLDIDPAAEERFRALVATHEKKLEAIAAIDAEGYVPREFELAIPAREYQRVAADLALRTGSLLVADDLGVGKSVTGICLFTAPGTLPALVVTMTHLTTQWQRELARFAPALRVHRIQKTTPYEFTDIRLERDPVTNRRRVVKHKGIPDVLVVNYSKLYGWVEHLSGVIRTIVFDECQALRRAESNGTPTRQYSAAKALADEADLRMGLSATPIHNYGDEVYNVMEVLAPGQLGDSKEFRDEWCSERLPNGKAKVGDPAALGTYLREAGLMIRRTRKDVGREIPPLTVIRHVVDSDPKSIERATADVAELAQRVLDRIGSPTDRMRTAGELDWRLRQATGIAKASAVSDFVRVLVDAGESVVLFGWHHAVFDLWRSSFERHDAEIRYAMYTGRESETQKDASAQRFIKGDAQVLIMSLRSGAGLDGLQHRSRTTVHGELDWAPAVMHQDIGRVHRDGQKEPVMAYVAVAEDGSDPVIEDVLGIKEAQSHFLLNPSASEIPSFTGAAENHIRRLAEDVIRRRRDRAA